MKKSLSLILFTMFIVSALSAQGVVDEKKLEKAKEEGNVLFESVLKDADFDPHFWRQEALKVDHYQGCWTLKFENGAILRKWEFIGADLSEDTGDVWWIGKKYVVYKVKNRWSREWNYRVELIKEPVEK